MAHVIKCSLLDLKAMATALKELEWYTSPSGGYRLTGVEVEGGVAAWQLESRPAEEKAAAKAQVIQERRRTVEPGDQVIVETKGQQLVRRATGDTTDGVEGVVFRVLTRGPHPHGMKVELRDRNVGRVKKNLTMPGAGEPTGR